MISIYEKIDEIVETMSPRVFADYMFHNYRDYLQDVSYHAQMELFIEDMEKEGKE